MGELWEETQLPNSLSCKYFTHNLQRSYGHTSQPVFYLEDK